MTWSKYPPTAVSFI